MKTKILALGFTMTLLSTPAFAFHCPKDMKKIDNAMASNPMLNESQMSMVKKLRADGEQFHKSGDHQKAVDTLAEAMSILNIK